MRISDWSSDVCSSDLLIVAGGMESMTNAPYLLKKHRGGARIGHDTAYDHMFLDGLEDAYEAGRAMGTFAQETADAYQLSRQAQDDYSIESLKRAQAAIAHRALAAEVTPVTMTTPTELGQTAVRGRSCQDGSVSGVRVSLKKK